jgi:ABC-type transporter Mla subunit MlaD
MRIKKFNEKEQIDISSERVEEIVDELRKLSSKLENGYKVSDSFINEFNNYKSDSQKGNDQIDDTVFALEVVKKNLDDSLDKLDTSLKNLLSYSQEGRKYLYTENK